MPEAHFLGGLLVPLEFVYNVPHLHHIFMSCEVFVMGTNIEGVTRSLSGLVRRFLSPPSHCFLEWHTSPCISIFEFSRGHF